MKKFTGLFLFLLAVSFLLNNSSNASTSSERRGYAGKVLEHNLPAALINVELIKFNEDNEPVYQKIVRTNSLGKFEFIDVPVSAGDNVKIGAFREELNADVSRSGGINTPDLEVIDIGAYANDIKGVVDNIIINPNIEFTQLDASVDNSNLLLQIASTSRVGSIIRPPHNPLTPTDDIGTYPAPGKPNLHQNYPNPFNPQTKIAFTISELSNVSLNVYDLSGKQVGELVNEQKAPGNYEVIFNGQNLASGFYIYKLTAGSFTEIKKMSLIK